MYKIELITQVGVFTNEQDELPVDSNSSPSSATEEDLGHRLAHGQNTSLRPEVALWSRHSAKADG